MVDVDPCRIHAEPGEGRTDVAVQCGPERIDAVLAGWLDADGPEVDELAYWDVLAALCTPTDLSDWVTVFTDQGRTDLDANTVLARRDRFLADGLARMTART